MIFNVKGKKDTLNNILNIENPELNDTYICEEDGNIYSYQYNDNQKSFIEVESGLLKQNLINISDKCLTCEKRGSNGLYQCFEECDEPYNVLEAISAMRKATSTRLFGGLL